MMEWWLCGWLIFLLLLSIEIITPSIMLIYIHKDKPDSYLASHESCCFPPLLRRPRLRPPLVQATHFAVPPSVAAEDE
ncbi:hypothetical protein B9Z19DRAFT_735570 [Tuber borchii]|uniref:Uncharacterized protein n=1 Tax=Tuber borchii TaxID=42251 RepID=A0A2T6Z9N4_TUBBO|nr:hypothetical protein B9Z19DRAFT_735570 [Tuber borchii]